MNSLTRRLSAAAVALTVTAVLWSAVPAHAQEPARLVPPLALLDRTGKAVRLDTFRGRVVLLDFWATWCIPCRVSLPAYDDMLRRYQKRGFEVLAVNVGETRAKVDAYFKDREPLIRVLMDPKGATAITFKVRALPTSLIIDRDGYIRYTIVGFEDGAIPAYHEQIQLLLDEPPSD